jgi:hypothetical protein
MALSNGTGGYQVGAGADGEAILSIQVAPTALTAAATATAAQLSGGLFTFNGTAGNLTLPTVADLEAGIPSAQKVNSSFDFLRHQYRRRRRSYFGCWHWLDDCWRGCCSCNNISPFPRAQDCRRSLDCISYLM